MCMLIYQRKGQACIDWIVDVIVYLSLNDIVQSLVGGLSVLHGV